MAWDWRDLYKWVENKENIEKYKKEKQKVKNPLSEEILNILKSNTEANLEEVRSLYHQVSWYEADNLNITEKESILEKALNLFKKNTLILRTKL